MVGTIYVSCPLNWNLLSCGNDNSQTSKYDPMRYTLAISSSTCECNDAYGMKCSAWCTDAPLLDLDQVMTILGDTRFGNAYCQIPGQVVGCGHKSLAVDGVKPSSSSFYPNSRSCMCSDNPGSLCLAFCASNAYSLENQIQEGKGKLVTSCSQPDNSVFGCGVRVLDFTVDLKWNYAHVVSATACQCFAEAYYQCLAICGILKTYS